MQMQDPQFDQQQVPVADDLVENTVESGTEYLPEPKVLGVLLLLLLVYVAPFFLVFSPWWRFGLFAGGVVAGVGLLLADRQYLWKIYQLSYVFSRSLLFYVLYVPLSLFLVSSSGSSFGIGFILGVGFYSAWELVMFFQKHKQIDGLVKTGNKPLTETESQILVAGAVGYWILLSVLVLF